MLQHIKKVVVIQDKQNGWLLYLRTHKVLEDSSVICFYKYTKNEYRPAIIFKYYDHFVFICKQYLIIVKKYQHIYCIIRTFEN